MDQTLLYSVPAIAILGLLVMAVQAAWVRKQDAGEARMAEIANHIHEGALAFLRAEYRILAIFVVIAGALLGLVASISSEVAYRVQRNAFDYLDAPVVRLCQSDTPFAFSPPLIDEALPQVKDIMEAVKSVAYVA